MSALSPPAPMQDRPAGLTRLAPLLPAAVVGLWVWFVLAFNPTLGKVGPTGPCLWHAMFGIDGPTCGITRMSWYLLHGDLIEAARHHLLALAAVPVLGYTWIWWAVSWLFSPKLPFPRLSRRAVAWVLIGYGVAFLLYSAVLRNLPWPPFTWFYVADVAP